MELNPRASEAEEETIINGFDGKCSEIVTFFFIFMPDVKKAKRHPEMLTRVSLILNKNFLFCIYKNFFCFL